jgi:VIT1/CCC1 family predicted Fe2+/Mn2+ transporter
MSEKQTSPSPTAIISSSEEYLSELVYGGIDGGVTTFAVVSGATGAGFSTEIILVLGIANLLADGLSMSIGSFLSSRAKRQSYIKQRDLEFKRTISSPEQQIEDVRAIYRSKGFEGKLLNEIVSVIVADPKLWVNEMMKDEIGMIPERRSPAKKALVTYLSFITVGSIPLLAYVAALLRNTPSDILFIISCALTLISFILIGSIKASLNKVNRVKAILETVLLGSIAAAVAYFAGSVLESLL